MNFWKIELIADWSLYTHEKSMKKGWKKAYRLWVYFLNHKVKTEVLDIWVELRWDEGKHTYSCRCYKKARDSEAISNNIATTLEISKRVDIKDLDIENIRIDTRPGKLLNHDYWPKICCVKTNSPIVMIYSTHKLPKSVCQFYVAKKRRTNGNLTIPRY